MRNRPSIDKRELIHNNFRDYIFNQPKKIGIPHENIIGKYKESNIYSIGRMIGSIDIVFETYDTDILTEIKSTNSSKVRQKGYSQCMKYLDWYHRYNNMGVNKSVESWLVYPKYSMAGNKRKADRSFSHIPLEIIIFDYNGQKIKELA